MSKIVDITVLLNRLAAGDPSAETELMPQIYEELKRVAYRHLAKERPGHTLQPTALVHEAYLRLVRQTRMHYQGRAHFYAMAARVMRRILVDHARQKRAEKRGGSAERIEISAEIASGGSQSALVTAVDSALRQLEKLDPRQSQIVEMRFFGGMKEDEIGEFLGISTRTVKRNWAVARAWLYGELTR